MGLATPTTMGEQPNLDEFIRHLQAELELSESIVDPVEQEQQRRVNTSVASQLTGCQKCGNPLESDLDFCSSCGHIQK